MKILKKITNFVISVICILSIALLVLVAVGYKPVTIMSGSMSPTLSVGELCFIHEEDSYREGNIVTFSVEDEYITHRIECDNGDGTFTTKGDANKTVDVLTLSEEQIVGKVAFGIPLLGYVTAFLTTLNGKIVAIALIVVLLMIAIILDSKEEPKPKATLTPKECDDAIKAINEGAPHTSLKYKEDEDYFDQFKDKNKNISSEFVLGIYETAEEFWNKVNLIRDLDILSYDEKVEYARELFEDAPNGDVLAWWNKQSAEFQKDLGLSFLGDDASDSDVMEFWNEVLSVESEDSTEEQEG